MQNTTSNSIYNLKIPTDKPILVIGKGPTFSKVINFDLNNYYTIGLNHVATQIKVDISHFIDIECLSESLWKNSNIIICPRYPHIYNRCKYKHIYKFLQDYSGCDEIYKKFYLYNCTTCKKEPLDIKLGQEIRVRFFSIEAVFRILGIHGVKEIHTLGIDGGTTYSHYFSHLKPLTNGRNSFDEQFNELLQIIKKWGIKWIRL